MMAKTVKTLELHYLMIQFLIKHIIKNWIIGTVIQMNASAFRDLWARVMLWKFSKLHEP